MKYFLCALLCAVVSIAQASRVSLRVAVQSEQDVIVLNSLGFTIDDVKIRERILPTGEKTFNVSWNSENRFVTVIAKRDDIAKIEQREFRILSVSEVDDMLAPVQASSADTIPYQFGWPRATFNGLSLYENSPTIADLDLNGQLDVSVTNAWGSYNPPNPPYVVTWRRNGVYLSGFPVPLEAGQLQSSADAGISAAADIYGDNKLELVCGDENGFLYAFTSGGIALAGFPRSFGAGTGVYTPALADVDGDGKADIAVITHDWSSPYGNAFLHLFKVIATGPVEFPGFPIALERGGENSPAIGDIDGNGSLEIVIGTGGNPSGPAAKILAFNSTGQVVSGFPYVVGASSVSNSPTLYDINNDGKLEILIRMKPDDNVNGIYAIDYRGTLMPGFPFPITFGNPGSCVAVGDVDGDNIPELAYGGVEAVDSGKVWVYSLAGNLLSGFPARVFRTWVDGSVAIADVDGDGKGDVVCGTNGVTNKPGVIHAFNYLGQEVTGFPLSPGNPILNSFETHPTLVDIDGDGGTEIFAGRLDKNVYGWDTPGVFDSAKVWRTFKGNAARTGGQLRSTVVSVGERNGQPGEFALEQNYPNPFNPSTTINISILTQSDFSLKIYDVLGREVKSFAFDQVPAGVHSVVWDGTNQNGVRMSSGIYLYELKAGNFLYTKKLMLLR